MVYPIAKYLLWPVLSLFVRDIKGLHNLTNKPCLYVCNHQSYIDAPLILMMIAWHKDKKVHTFALKDRFNGRIWNMLFKHFGAIRVNGSVDKALGKVRTGGQLLLFPEGRRCKKEKVQKVNHHGLGVIAAKTGIPVIPIGIDSYHFWNVQHLLPRFHRKINVRIGKPLRFKRRPTEKAFVEITEATMEEVKKLARKAHTA